MTREPLSIELTAFLSGACFGLVVGLLLRPVLMALGFAD